MSIWGWVFSLSGSLNLMEKMGGGTPIGKGGSPEMSVAFVAQVSIGRAASSGKVGWAARVCVRPQGRGVLGKFGN